MGKLYDENSIESLSPLEFTRLKPGVYCGDTTYSTQLLIEIISNAIDEYTLGHGTEIRVSIDTDNIITVEDNGQGFIVNSFRDDGKTILEAAFSVLNTSGKYREDGSYEGTSLGSYGIGSKIANFLSHWLEVQTFRDGQFEYILFEEGVFKERGVGEADRESGTKVSWKPSEEFFTHSGVEIQKVKNLFKTVCCLCPGLKIILREEDKETIFFSKNGLNDLVDGAVSAKEIIKNRFDMKFVDGKYKMDMVMTYTSNYSSTIVPYVNTGLTESGQHITQIKTVLTREFNKFFREKKWLKEKDENLTGDDIQEGMYLVFNITAPGVSYDAQVKSRIVKIDMKSFVQALAENLQSWFVSNEKEIKGIAEKALNARKARDAAKKAREAIRGNKKDKKKKFLDMPTKLVEAWNKKNRLDCELYIVEGDSAANGLVEVRNSEFQAIFPIRGKMISAYKNTIEKIFANQEIGNLIKALGLELDLKKNKLVYDVKKLRYGKIIAAADADPDGKSIKNLIYTNIWQLCPELIINGHVYAALPPLYRITTKKNEYIYLKDDSELQGYKEKHINENYIISRNKGIGEQDKEELEESILNPNTRNIVQIEVSDVNEANQMFEILMGNSVPPRREYLLNHSEEATEL